MSIRQRRRWTEPTAGSMEELAMLVLTRRPNESIMIGDDVEVSILCVNGDKVKIGIRAPYEVPLLRTEIYVAPEHRSRDRMDRVAH